MNEGLEDSQWERVDQLREDSLQGTRMGGWGNPGGSLVQPSSYGGMQQSMQSHWGSSGGRNYYGGGYGGDVQLQRGEEARGSMQSLMSPWKAETFSDIPEWESTARSRSMPRQPSATTSGFGQHSMGSEFGSYTPTCGGFPSSAPLALEPHERGVHASGNAARAGFSSGSSVFGNSPVQGDDEQVDTSTTAAGRRKEKHKIVEQRRREKSKELLAEVQSLLPEKLPDRPSMNEVLSATVKHLKTLSLQPRSSLAPDSEDRVSEDGSVSSSNEADKPPKFDPAFAYRAGIMLQEHGISLASIDGSFVDCNLAFARVLGFNDPRDVVGKTFFSFTCPEDMPGMLQMTSQMLKGDVCAPKMIKRCILADSSVKGFHVEMRLIRKGSNGAPHCFMCSVKPSIQDDENRKRPRIEEAAVEVVE